MQLPQPSPSLISQGFSARVVLFDGEPGRPLIVGEAPGKTEDETGLPFHPEAEAGGLFKRLMERVGVTRERFSITNVVWQRPPWNELHDEDGNAKSYTHEAIDYWTPYLHELITELQPPVIIGLGRTALETLTGFSDIGTTRGYVNLARIEIAKPDDQWELGDDPYDKKDLNIPTLCTYHPQFLNYGNRYLSGVFIRDVLEALDIADKGWHPPKLNVTPNPTIEQFRWFCQQYNPDRHILTYDIETPDSSDLPEDELTDNGKEISGEIIRASFCFDTGVGGYSIPWQEPFISIARDVLASSGAKCSWNGRLFDRPRLLRYQISVNGREYDLLDRWRHLHRTLPASLAFVAPFYLNISPWKHESHTQPEWYSAMDAIVEHMVAEGTERDLRSTDQWEVYERHVVDVLALAEKMSQNGLPYDSEKAAEFERELEAKQAERLERLQVLVPDHLKPVKQKEGLKKIPKVVEKAIEEWGNGVTDNIGTIAYVLLHTGYVQREFTLWENGLPVKVTRWAKLLPFNPDSWQQKLKLIQHFGHKPKTDRKTRKPTTGDATMRHLVTQCLKSKKPGDELALECYKLIRECVAIATALGFVRGWKPGPDGCLHATPGLWGDMFRLSWRKPPLSATPADKKEIQIAAGFRKCICVPSDQVIIEADWQSQEAVILGWYAKSESYIRLARLSLNAYMTSHLLNRPAELSWSDADLGGYLREIKDDKRNVKLYDDAKHTIYLIQNGGTPYLISEAYDMSMERATFLYKFYFDLFPEIERLHKAILQEAHEKCRLTNPWGYRMPIWEAYKWDQKRFDRLRKLWVKYQTQGSRNSNFTARDCKDIERIAAVGGDNLSALCYDLGTEAKAALSFYPRDTGSAMLKDALLALEEDYQMVSCGVLRATAHDSIVGIAPRANADGVAGAMKEVMERPQQRLDGLVVGVDVAIGQSWDKKSLVGWKPQMAMAAHA